MLTMTNSELQALALPLIAVVAVGITTVAAAYHAKHRKPSPRPGSSGVLGRLSENEAGIFHFQPESGSAETATFKKIIEKETAGN
jgi:hypothetical protein